MSADQVGRPRASAGPGPLDYLLGGVQFLYPHHLLSRAMYRLTRMTLAPLKNGFIRWFVGRYQVDLEESEESELTRYATFNAFFTRALRPGARTLPDEPGAVVCPVDGQISQLGAVERGSLVQAKGHDYTLAQLVTGDPARYEPFLDGKFATLYLSPKNYHRVHMPCPGTLREMTYVPGRLFSVNQSTSRVVPRLYARNERVVCLFDTPAGPMALVLVGALFVGSVETVWHGEVAPGPSLRHWRYAEDAPQLQRGEEMGRFNMGSTVVLLLTREACAWLSHLQSGQVVQMGDVIGRRP